MYDTKHGHGRMVYSDGSLYEVCGLFLSFFYCFSLQGQWRANRYHGDGSLFHASGIIYEGLWIDGYPECMSSLSLSHYHFSLSFLLSL